MPVLMHIVNRIFFVLVDLLEGRKQFAWKFFINLDTYDEIWIQYINFLHQVVAMYSIILIVFCLVIFDIVLIQGGEIIVSLNLLK